MFAGSKVSQSLPQLIMRRPHLRRLPEPALVEGYTIRDFEPGDEDGWNRLMAASFERDLSEFNFRRMMARHPAFRRERVKLAVADDTTLAATASSWVDARFGPDNAILHWVGTHPGHVGQRLGYEVSLAALQQAGAERRGAATLLTDDGRIAAIKTYLRLGFVPVLSHASHADRWGAILKKLGTHTHHLALLDGPLEKIG